MKTSDNQKHQEIVRRIREFSEDGYERANVSCESDKWAVIHAAPVQFEKRVSPSVWVDDTSIIGYYENDEDLSKGTFLDGDILILVKELNELLNSIEIQNSYP